MSKKRTSKSIILNIPAIEVQVKKLLNGDEGYEEIDSELLSLMRSLKIGDKLLLSVNKRLVVIFKSKNQNNLIVPFFYSEIATNIDWLATDKRFRELEKLVGESIFNKKSTIILLVEGEETTLENFIKANIAEDVEPITAKDIKLVKSLKIGKSVPVGMVIVKRIK